MFLSLLSLSTVQGETLTANKMVSLYVYAWLNDIKRIMKYLRFLTSLYSDLLHGQLIDNFNTFVMKLLLYTIDYSLIMYLIYRFSLRIKCAFFSEYTYRVLWIYLIRVLGTGEGIAKHALSKIKV